MPLTEQLDADNMRIPPVRRWDDWTRWLIGGLVAGLVAWGGVGSRLASLETEVRLSNQRAIDERTDTRDRVREISTQLSSMKEDLTRLQSQIQDVQAGQQTRGR